jgi:plastocyanin
MSSGTAIGRVLAVLATFVLILALATPSQAATVRVRGNNQQWHPRSVSITQGTRVVWRAVDTTHTVTAYRGNWSKNTTIATGERTGFTFNSSGRFKYRCTIHSTLSNGVCSGMCGKVVVS